MSRLPSSFYKPPDSEPDIESIDPGLWRKVLNTALSGLETTVNVLDTPGAFARGVIANQPIDELFQGIIDPSKRVYGKDITGSKNFFANFGTEVLLDPLMYISFGSAGVIKSALKGAEAATTASKVAKAIGNTKHLTRLSKEKTESLGKLKSVIQEQGVQLTGKETPDALINLGKKLPSATANEVRLGLPLKSLSVKVGETTKVPAAFSAAGKILGTGAKAIPGVKPVLSKISSDLGSPVLNETRNQLRAMARESKLRNEQFSLLTNKRILDIAEELKIQPEQAQLLFRRAIEAEDGIKKLALDIDVINKETGLNLSKDTSLEGTEHHLNIFRKLNLEDVEIGSKIFQKLPKEIAEWLNPLIARVGLLRNLESKYNNIPDVIKEFARTYSKFTDAEFLDAQRLGVSFAERKGVIGYLHRFLTPDGIEVFKDRAVRNELSQFFNRKHKGFSIKEEGLQKSRRVGTENALLDEVNEFLVKKTGRNVQFFETDPTKIGYHYLQGLTRKRLQTQLLTGLIKLNQLNKVKGDKSVLSLVDIIKPGKGKPRLGSWGFAKWAHNASKSEIRKQLKKFGYDKIAIPRSSYKEFKHIFDVTLGKPEVIQKELRVFDEVLNTYRASLTAFFPAFAIRNIFNAIVMNSMAGNIGLGHYKTAFSLLREGRGQKLFLENQLTPYAASRENIQEALGILSKPTDAHRVEKAAKSLGLSDDVVQFLGSIGYRGQIQLLNLIENPAILDAIKTGKIELVVGTKSSTAAGEMYIDRNAQKIIIRLSKDRASSTTLLHEVNHATFRLLMPNDIREDVLDTLFDSHLFSHPSVITRMDDYIPNYRHIINRLYKHVASYKAYNPGLEEVSVSAILRNKGFRVEVDRLEPGLIADVERVRRTSGEELFVQLAAEDEILRILDKHQLEKIRHLITGITFDMYNYHKVGLKRLLDPVDSAIEDVNKLYKQTESTVQMFESALKNVPHDRSQKYYTAFELIPDKEIYGFKNIHELLRTLAGENIITGGQVSEISELVSTVIPSKNIAGRAAKGFRQFAQNPIKSISGGKVDLPYVPIGYDPNQNLENIARVAHYIGKREAGLNHTQAAASVKKYLFDYFDLTPFEKKYLRRAFLFYTFTRKNIPLMASSIVEHPRFLLNYGRMAQTGREKTPDWVPDSVIFENDNGERLALSLGLAFEDLDKYSPQGKGISRSLQKLASELSPPFRAPLAAMSGKEFFTGRPMEGGVIERALQESPASRAVSTFQRLKSGDPGKVLGLFTSITARRFNEKDVTRTIQLDKIEARLDQLVGSGKARKLENFGYRYINGQRLKDPEVARLLSLQAKLKRDRREE